MTITGDRLRELRQRQGMSQEKVAEIIGVSRSTYVKYEAGVNKPVRSLEKLARLFGTTADYIMGYSKVVPKKKESSNLLSEKEERLLSLFRQLDIEDQSEIIGEIKGALRNNKYKKDTHISA